MIELTEGQLRQICDEGWPPRAFNPATQEMFVLLPTDMFERVRAILETEDEIAAVEEMSILAGEVLDAGESSSRESA